MSFVGQIVNLRPIVNRPGARPQKLPRLPRQPALHRIHLDVIRDPLKLHMVTDQPIIAFVLPERVSGETQNSIAFEGGESLERLHHFGDIGQRSHQEMNVVRHHDVGVKLVVSFPLSIVDGVDYYGCDVGASKVKRTCAGVVEKPVHRHEGLSGGARRRESAIRREAALQAPGDEDGVSEGVVVRQAATVKGGHEERVGGEGGSSQEMQEGRLTIGRRLTICPTSRRQSALENGIGGSLL